MMCAEQKRSRRNGNVNPVAVLVGTDWLHVDVPAGTGEPLVTPVVPAAPSEPWEPMKTGWS